MLKKSLTCNICALRELCSDLNLKQSEAEHFESINSSTFSVEKGEHLFSKGDATKAIYAVRNGSFKITNEHNKILDFSLTGDFLGLDIFDDSIHKVNAIALEHTTVCAYDVQSMYKLLNKAPTFNQYFLRIFTRLLNSQLNSLNHHLDATQRLVGFFLKLSKHNASRGFSSTEFTLSAKRQDIANYLDLAPETISRLLHKFEEDNILQVKNKHIEIKDLNRLEALF